MTSASSVLSLSARPRSVAEARQWVVEVCRAIDREDVVECAELAMSELVTNAILHGEPPLSVRLGGTPSHPRFEVADGSRQPPAPPVPESGDELLSTVGRGLRLVAICAEAWGARVGVDGKVVWFVPSTEPGGGTGDAPRIEYDEEAPADVPRTREDPVDIHIPALAVRRYRELRRHVSELRRELRLLALASEADYPIAQQLSEVFRHFEIEFAASVNGELTGYSPDDVVDVDVVVDRGGIETVAQLLDVLELADSFARSERLLSVAPSPEQRAFNRWYLSEFIRQGRGHAPTVWTAPARRDPPESPPPSRNTP